MRTFNKYYICVVSVTFTYQLSDRSRPASRLRPRSESKMSASMSQDVVKSTQVYRAVGCISKQHITSHCILL